MDVLRTPIYLYFFYWKGDDRMARMSNLKIRHKMQLTGILYLALIAIVLYFFISSNTLIRQSTEHQQALNALSTDIRHLEIGIKDYVYNRLALDVLRQRFEGLGKRLADPTLVEDLNTVQEQTNALAQLRARNQVIEEKIDKLTEASLNASNVVIKAISDRLVGAQTRWDVSDMERAVIVGANMNTNANFRIKVLFGKLKADIGVKDSLIDFLDTLVKNVTKDIERLKGTENEAAARQAKATNLIVKELVLEYIANVNKLNASEKQIMQSIDSIDHGIEGLVLKSSENVFGKIKGYFSTIISVILAASILGILINFIQAKAISGSLNQLNQRVRDLAEGEGDLTKRILVRSQDETGELAQWINLFVEKLQHILRDVKNNADSLHQASGTLTDVSHQMSTVPARPRKRPTALPRQPSR